MASGQNTLRIAMICLHSDPLGQPGDGETGGMSVYVSALAVELGQMGHTVDIFSQDWQGRGTGRFNLYQGVSLIPLAIGHRALLAKDDLYKHLVLYQKVFDAFCQADDCHYDIIHSNYWLSGCLAELTGIRARCAHVITFHTLAGLKDRSGAVAQESHIRHAAEQTLIGQVERLLVPSENEKREIVSYYTAVEQKISLVPGGVDLRRFLIVDQDAARKKLGIESDSHIIFAVGRIDPIKGFERAIRALAHISGEPLLIIAGGADPVNPEVRRLADLAKSLGVSEQVCFLGALSQVDMVHCYGAVDVVVQSSLHESFGLAALEGMACGRPLISTRAGVAVDLAATSCPGLLLCDGSPEDIARAVMLILNGMVGWTSDAIRQSVSSFSWHTASLAAIEAYREALGMYSGE